MSEDKKKAFIVHSMTVEDENGNVFFINLDDSTCVQTNGQSDTTSIANMLFRAGMAIGSIYKAGYVTGK